MCVCMCVCVCVSVRQRVNAGVRWRMRVQNETIRVRKILQANNSIISPHFLSFFVLFGDRKPICGGHTYVRGVVCGPILPLGRYDCQGNPTRKRSAHPLKRAERFQLLPLPWRQVCAKPKKGGGVVWFRSAKRSTSLKGAHTSKITSATYIYVDTHTPHTHMCVCITYAYTNSVRTHTHTHIPGQNLL